MQNKYLAMLSEGLLSKWSIIPAFLLLVICIIIMGMQLIHADPEYYKPPMTKKLLTLSPLVPLVWFVALFIAGCYRVIKNGFNKYDVIQILVTMLVLLAVCMFAF